MPISLFNSTKFSVTVNLFGLKGLNSPVKAL